MRDVFVYQMGRVGSNSITRSLYNAGLNTFHAHWLKGDFPEAEFSTSKPKIVEMIKTGEFEPRKIITSVRDPMARNLSAFVFSLIRYGVSGRQESPEKLRSVFLNKYNIYYPDEWFEKELVGIFGFDPFVKKFNTKLGYQLYKKDKYEILILRLENANDIFPVAIKKLLGIKNVQMVHESDLTTKKYIGEKYKILKQLKYPEEFVNKVYDLKYVNHFYTKAEIEEFKNKWSE